MTNRERYLRVFRGEPVDRMPVSLFIQDQGHLLNQLYPEISSSDYDSLQKASVDFQREMGADVFLRILFDEELPYHVLFGGVNVTQQTETWKVETVKSFKGQTEVWTSKITTPEGCLDQEFSIFKLYDQTLMLACTKKPVKDEDDLDLVIKYEPGMNPKFPASIKARVERMKAYIGDDGIVGAWIPYGPFNNASHLIELEDLYSLFLTEPEFYKKLLEFSVRRLMDYTQAYMDTDLDAFFVGGNVPGGFMGGPNYEKYALPYEKTYIDYCQSTGKPCIYHNCGSIMPLIESYKSLGSRIIEPFSPAPLGDTNLQLASDTINGAYIMICGVDQVNVIQKGTKEDVIRITKQTAEIAKQNKCNIIQNADFFEYGTPVENIRAFVETAKACGTY